MTAATLRLAGLSAQYPWRLLIVNAGLLALVALAVLSQLLGGTYPITLSDISAALRGEADAITHMVVLEHRLPRLMTALGVGLAFGIAGELVQTLLRNPLASPDIIGFSAGAASGAVLTVALTGASTFVLPGALLGGIAAAALILALAWKGGVRPGALIIMGIGVTLTLSVVTDLLMTRLDATRASELVKWLVGTLSARSWNDAALIWGGLVLLTPLALVQQFALARVSMDAPVATGLGIAVDRTRLITLLLAIALVALCVATAGPLPFVAFVAGPIAHGLNGRPRPTLFTAALVGALVTLAADAATQALPGIIILPAGVFTALIGAPVLLVVLLAQIRKGRQ
ncbi:MAG: iron chelate uptake ABC transporter family permease subunit [Pseudomonadota bacterium]